MDVVTFLDIEMSDAAKGSGTDVDIGFGLDLTCATDGRDKILADDLASGDFDNACLAMEDGSGDNACQSQDNDDYNDNLLGAHTIFLDSHGNL